MYKQLEYIYKMSVPTYDSVFSRLLSLFPHEELLTRLQNTAVIAGGSVVYALVDSVPKESVGDIDVWINDKELFRELLNEINSTMASVFHIFEHENDESVNLTLVTVSFPYNPYARNVQLILTSLTDPTEIVETFDMDYVQCAIHKGQVYRTERCKKAHATKTVRYISQYTHMYRLKKAVDKGFSTPLFIYDIKKWNKSTNNLVKVSYQYIQNRRIDYNKDYAGHLLYDKNATLVKIKNQANSFKWRKTYLFIKKPRVTIDKLEFKVGNVETCYAFFRVSVVRDVFEGTNALLLNGIPESLKTVRFFLQNNLEQYTNQNSSEIWGDTIVCVWFYKDTTYRRLSQMDLWVGKVCGAVPYNELYRFIEVDKLFVEEERKEKYLNVIDAMNRYKPNKDNDTRTTREILKYEAYEYFLKLIKEGCKEEDAVRKTRARINGEMYKNDAIDAMTGGFFFLLNLRESRNVKDMIHFIEGF